LAGVVERGKRSRVEQFGAVWRSHQQHTRLALFLLQVALHSTSARRRRLAGRLLFLRVHSRLAGARPQAILGSFRLLVSPAGRTSALRLALGGGGALSAHQVVQLEQRESGADGVVLLVALLLLLGLLLLGRRRHLALGRQLLQRASGALPFQRRPLRPDDQQPAGAAHLHWGARPSAGVRPEAAARTGPLGRRRLLRALGRPVAQKCVWRRTRVDGGGTPLARVRGRGRGERARRTGPLGGRVRALRALLCGRARPAHTQVGEGAQLAARQPAGQGLAARPQPGGGGARRRRVAQIERVITGVLAAARLTVGGRRPELGGGRAALLAAARHTQPLVRPLVPVRVGQPLVVVVIVVMIVVMVVAVAGVQVLVVVRVARAVVRASLAPRVAPRGPVAVAGALALAGRPAGRPAASSRVLLVGGCGALAPGLVVSGRLASSLLGATVVRVVGPTRLRVAGRGRTRPAVGPCALPLVVRRLVPQAAVFSESAPAALRAGPARVPAGRVRDQLLNVDQVLPQGDVHGGLALLRATADRGWVHRDRMGTIGPRVWIHSSRAGGLGRLVGCGRD